MSTKRYHVKVPNRLVALSVPMLGLIIALVFSGLIIVISGNSPLEVYGTIFRGAFGSMYGFTSVLRWMTPLLFLGISASFALRAGLWNLGMEGQMYLGAIFGTWIGFTLVEPPGIIITTVAVLVAAVVGALWALGPALLRAFFGTNEFIVTLLLNFVAVHLTDFLTLNYWTDDTYGGETLSTLEIVESARLARILPKYTWNTSFLIGLACIFLFLVIMKYFTIGFELRVHGKNPKFLKYGGVSVKRTIILAMCLSGATAGMTGAFEILGVYKCFHTRMFAGGVAWDGLVVALLGLFQPIGIVIAAFIFGFLKIGLLMMERLTDISRAVVTIIQSLLIFFIAAQGLALSKRKTGEREE